MKPGTSITIVNFIKRFLLHALIAWLIFNIGDWVVHFYNVQFGLAYAVNADGSPVSAADRFINNNLNQPLGLWILLLAFLAEANYLFIFKQQKFLWFCLSSLLLAKAGSGISMLFQKHSPYVPALAQYIDSAFFILVYIFGYAILFNFFHERYQKARLGQSRSESELYLLKAQINPHFFFNTLNNLYGMAINEKALQTADAIELLAGMMRYNMNGMQEDYIDLDIELKFIENYLALQRLRIPQRDNITINIDIEHPVVKYPIAPMLLIPLIENAWKYGLSMDHPCYINLKIGVITNQLVLLIENRVFPVSESDSGSGLGITNVRRRLGLIYPDRHRLLIEHSKNTFRVNLTIVL